ncbi:MAG: ATP-binding protein [Caulobacter sp.]|nr:ATP-binding protein [Caulobacter sp.]
MNAKLLPSVHQTALEAYYRRTYGDQLAIRLASVLLLSCITIYMGVWPLSWAAVWALGYLGGELAIVVWWRQAQSVLPTADKAGIDRLQAQLIGLSAAVSAYAAIPCFFTLGGPPAAQIVGVLIAAGMLLIIGAQHSLHPHMFLATAPVGALALLWNLHALGDGMDSWLFVALGVGLIANARYLQVGNASAFKDLIQHKYEADRALSRSRESQALYRLLADNQSDMIALWGADGSPIYSTPSVVRAFGYTLEERALLPQFINLHPEDAEAVRKVFQSLKPEDGARAIDYRMFHKDGSVVWVDGTFQRLDDGSERLLATGRVSTERKQLQRELHEALDRAKAALKAKSDFLANMTHELRTPLTAIVGFSNLMKAAEDLNPRHARQMGIIHDASENLLTVVNDVLDFSRLEAGAVELDAHPFDPLAMARSTLALLASQAEAKGIVLSVNSDGADGMLLGDGARLRQVLTNLISNAVKFTASGEILVTVRQTVAGDQRRLRIAVRDSGIGISSDQLGGIFGRFTQADASVSRRYGGTGLGLAISRLIVEAMNGLIEVESQPGEGSTFWFEVVMPPADRVLREEPDQGPAAEMGETLRLLVVDDNPVNRELVCALLEPFDVEIETANDGVEAVEAAGRARFDLILMDLQMPNMDGLTATKHIRAAAAPGQRRVPIVALTANVLPEQIARCLEAGMDDHLGKPIHPERLVNTISRWAIDDQAETGGLADPVVSATAG